MHGVSTGNCERNPPERKGWLVGRFIDEDPLRRTDAVEIKWGSHRRGERNGAFFANRTATSVSILVSGRFRLVFRSGEETETVVLAEKGDYAAWGPGVYHDWEAEEDCEVLTVRWPSVERDQIAFGAE